MLCTVSVYKIVQRRIKKFGKRKFFYKITNARGGGRGGCGEEGGGGGIRPSPKLALAVLTWNSSVQRYSLT